MRIVNDVKELIVSKVYNNVCCEFKYNNFILIGKNMSGKSKLIKNIVSENEGRIYYIDSVNRTIPNNNPAYRFNQITTINEINSSRIKKENFNKNDVITSTINNAIILNELIENIDFYASKLNDFFGVEFQIISHNDQFSNITYKYKLGHDTHTEISSGYQAIIRIIVEATFAVSQGCGFIVIDEIDAHLDNESCMKLIEFLNTEFPVTCFLVSTHSPNIILKSKDYNIIKIIENDFCEFFDGNDMDDLNYINRTIFCSNKRIDNHKNTIDSILADFARKLASGYKLTHQDINEISSLNDLTVKQNVLKEFILRW